MIIPANDECDPRVSSFGQKMADAILEGGSSSMRAEGSDAEDMVYAPTTPGEQYEIGVPRAKRTPRVYEPEEDEDYPLGGQRYEEPAEDVEAAPVEKKEDE